MTASVMAARFIQWVRRRNLFDRIYPSPWPEIHARLERDFSAALHTVVKCDCGKVATIEGGYCFNCWDDNHGHLVPRDAMGEPMERPKRSPPMAQCDGCDELENEVERLRERDRLHKEYIELLIESGQGPHQIAHVHGFHVSQADIKKGEDWLLKPKYPSKENYYSIYAIRSGSGD